MNAENFHEYLRNPSMLYQISHQELKSLVLQYPFSPNLRHLLMLKNFIDHNKDYNKNLTLASLYSLDRRKLWNLVKQHKRLSQIQENYTLSEEFLELKDLNSIEELLENPTAAISDAPAKQYMGGEDLFAFDDLDSVPQANRTPDHDEDDELEFLEKLFNDDTLSESNLTNFHDFDDKNHLQDIESNGVLATLETLENEARLSENIEEELLMADEDETEIAAETAIPDAFIEQTETQVESSIDETPQEIPLEISSEHHHEHVAPAPKSAFGSWKVQPEQPAVNFLKVGLRELAHPPKKVSKKSKKEQAEADEADRLAAISLAEDTGILSNTLAALLESQGHYDRAISMYQRLSLQYPEKSGFFAAKMEELRLKL